MPISVVRRVTVYPSTPYRPTAASSSAVTAKALRMRVISRSFISDRSIWIDRNDGCAIRTVGATA